MRPILLLALVSALTVGCNRDPSACGYPPAQGPTEPCCERHGADACAGGLFCAALDGRTIASCYFERSRADGQSCTGDVQCASTSCNTTAGACRSVGPSCQPEIGCAPLAGAPRACGVVDDMRVCVDVGDGSLGALCGDDTDCDDGLRCDPAEARCASCSGEVVPGPAQLDVLLVVDNSNSMSEEQARLIRELPRLVGALSTGDRDGDGAPDFTPPESVHLGVVTTDMGSGGFAVPTCDRGTFGNRFGDDGVLITRGQTAIDGCMAAYPSVLHFAAGAAAGPVAMDLACVATVGTRGCGFEQQLDAMLKAVSPSSPQPWTLADYAPPRFAEGTAGHGSGANAGFLRDGSALAVVILTDEEDGSLLDPRLVDPTTSEYPGDLGLRAFMYPEALHPIDRYVRGEDGRSGLLGLRRNPDQIFFSVIAGVPVEAIGNPAAPDYAAILAHPSMQEQLDPDAPATSPRLRPSCNTSIGVTFPPRRIVQVAQGLAEAGARVTVGSICQESYAGPIDTLVGSLTELPGCR